MRLFTRLALLTLLPVCLQSLRSQSCPTCCNPSVTCEAGGDAQDTCRWPPGGCPYPNQTVVAGCCCNATPILIDVDNLGFKLTDAQRGVLFDIGGDGKKDQVSWPEPGSTNAWLVYDRNGNGLIDSGKELFGNATVQPIPSNGEKMNGFLALSVLDLKGWGGNEDGVVDAKDAQFSELRLWQDLNHNGISEPSELKSLSSYGVSGIELKYRLSKKTDAHGNRFRYRAKIRGAKDGSDSPEKWAWDVILVVDNSKLMSSWPAQRLR